MMATVFVYGTLKQGFGNHHVMRQAGGEFITEARIAAGAFTMVDLGWFPGLVANVAGGEVSGEVFEVETLDPLDRLEGYPRFYNRKIVQTDTGHSAWVYYLEDARADGDVVASGMWGEK